MDYGNETVAKRFATNKEEFNAAYKTAEEKDKALKMFFIEHISPNMEVETNENGEPLAESFIEVNQRRFELAEEIFKRYKEFEKRFV